MLLFLNFIIGLVYSSENKIHLIEIIDKDNPIFKYKIDNSSYGSVEIMENKKGKANYWNSIMTIKDQDMIKEEVYYIKLNKNPGVGKYYCLKFNDSKGGEYYSLAYKYDGNKFSDAPDMNMSVNKKKKKSKEKSNETNKLKIKKENFTCDRILNDFVVFLMFVMFL